MDDRTHTFNTELQSALELGFMLDVAESIVQSALGRTESRGAHQRTDHPSRDDKNFLAHSLLFRNLDGSSRVEYSPVRLTRWPPGERVYGQGEEPTKTMQPAEQPTAVMPERRAS
jgi:fumarate reductase flavoprotein subunit